MLLQFAFPFLLASPTNKVGDTSFPCSGNFALGHGGAPSHFGSPASSCSPPQNLHWPCGTASEILGASESDLHRLTPESVWGSEALDLLTTKLALVSTLDDQQCPPQHNAESTKFAKAEPEGIHLGEVPIIKYAEENLYSDCPSTKKSPDGPPCRFKFPGRWLGQSQWLGTLSTTKNFAGLTVQGGSHTKNFISKRIPKATESTREVVRSGVCLPPKSTDQEPGIVSWVDQSDAQAHSKQSFEITSIEALTVHAGVLCEFVSMDPRPVWMDDALDFLASGRVLSPNSHDQQCHPQHGAESLKSAKAQPEAINLGEAPIIKRATENLRGECPSTKKSPYGLLYSFNFADRSLVQNQWLGIISATDNLAGLPVWGGSCSKKYTSKQIPKATDPTPKVVRSRVSLLPKNSKLEPGIGGHVDQSDARIRVEQSFDFALVEALPAQFGVIDGLHAMASKTNSQRHFRECRADFESTIPLLPRLTRSDLASISPTNCRSTAPGSAQSATQNADGYPLNPPLGRSHSSTNHMPVVHPDEVPRANFLANATTISAQSRAKAGCPAHLRQTQTPNKTTP